MKKTILVSAVLLASLLALPARAQGGGGVQERVAAIKNSMIASQQDLRTYQWVETTTVSYKGEQKSFKEQSCYYGADGSLQKLPIASSPAPKKKGGLRGAIADSKKEEMTDTMKQAAGLVKTYVPPNPANLDRAVKAGNVTVDMLQPGKVVRLNFKNYELPGDSLGITLDVTTNRLLGINVNTYLGDPSKPVTMTTTMGQLQDGATYTAKTELSVPAEKIVVDISNSGYRKM
jgi:hypothetical protein